MTNKRTIEAKGSDVDSAIAKGLAELNLNRDDVTIEILDEGSRGLFGLGGRPALVRLIVDIAAAPEMPAPVAQVEPTPAPKPTPPPAPAPAPRPVAPKPIAAAPTPTRHDDDTDEGEESDHLTEAELTHEGEVAVDVVHTLLNYLSVTADVSLTLSDPDDLTGRRINMINISGNDLGVLIGPRGETLDSFQFVSRLVVAHQIERKASFTLDVEWYRQRRKDALAQLATRMARKVTKQRRPVTLEPMPPHERRAIHMALRNFKGVYTQSTGVGDRRRVRIYPER